MFAALRTTATSPADVIRRDTTTVPAQFLPFIGGGFEQVTDRTALAIPAFYRGLSLRTGVLSTLPLKAHAGGEQLDFMPPILAQPDPSENRQVTITKIEASLVLRGEAVCVLGGFDEFGFPNVLTVINPDLAALNADGSWTINNKKVSRDEILHIVAFALPGETRGCGAVELHRMSIEGEGRAQEYQRNFYQYGAQPSIVVTVNRPDVSVEELEALKRSWVSKLRSRREPIIVPGDTSVSPLTLSNRDSQFIEGRQFALSDIANIVGVPGYFLGAPGAPMTYSNVTDQRRDLLDLYLRSDLYAIERAFSSLLPDPVKAEFSTDAFLRLDAKGTAEVMAIETQWLTINELRALKNLAPLPGGDTLAGVTAPTPGVLL